MELWMLLGAALLLLLLPPVYGAGMIGRVGANTVFGNRDGFPEITGWPARGKRAHQNLIENIVPFAIVVLVAAQLGVSNGITQAGAVLFLFFRIVHAASYLAGIRGLRTLAYHGGTLGSALVASQLF